MSEHYKHGSMDISEQERTFHGFLRVAAFGIVVAVVVLLVLTTRI